ncbi:MAG: ACP S-malonyltransferase [Proteobacteria bacterium]|nr:ACP S-malonyltransferase [Pseudomonadota bacterium]
MLKFNKNNTALVFPGQGSQKVGMAQSFYKSTIGKNLIEKAEGILNMKISEVMFEGPQEELNKTNNAQLALFISGYIACEYLKEQTGKPIEELAKYLAGHSLGEYTALVQAGVFSFEDALLLVNKRAKFMFEATQQQPGGMVAILGLRKELINELTQETGTFLANDNTIGQIVISGDKSKMKDVSIKAKSLGAKRVIELPVTGAFHSPLMQTAADNMAKEIDSIPMNDAIIPVVMNVSGIAHTKAEEIKENMKKQITGSVKWLDTMEFMKSNNINNVAELGTGNVLCGLFKKFDKEITTTSLTTIESTKEFTTN